MNQIARDVSPEYNNTQNCKRRYDTTIMKTAIEKTDFLIILCTCPVNKADYITNHLIAHQLAGCINQIPNIKSTFRWEGKVNVEEETLLIIKSTANKWEEIKNVIISVHPYDIPEILAIPIVKGETKFLGWLLEQLV